MAGQCGSSTLEVKLLIFFVFAFGLPLCSAQDTGEIRLSGGSSSNEGRVEIFLNNRWGTVCNDSWTKMDVDVVCRQLNNRTAVSTYMTPYEAPETVPIWYHDVQCSGDEQRLQDCPHLESSVDPCSHKEDAGAICEPKEDDVRLVGGSEPNEGRVEIYRESAGWGSVCASSSWNMSEANVVCRNVGYPSGALNWTRDFGKSTSNQAWLGNVRCEGHENAVVHCKGVILRTMMSCELHEKEATVVCNTAPLVPEEELSKGAIAGISIGFGLVIVVCCLFSLNCKCRPCWKKQEPDDTDVYQANTTSNADSRNYNSQVKSELLSESQQEPVSEIDPNLFLFAPKNPPPGTSASSAPGVEGGKLESVGEGKEPNGVPPIARDEGNPTTSVGDAENHDHATVISMTADDGDGSVNDTKVLIDDKQGHEVVEGYEQSSVDADVDEKRDDEGVTVNFEEEASYFVAGPTSDSPHEANEQSIDTRL